MGDFWGDYWERCYRHRHGYPSQGDRADLERLAAFVDDITNNATPETNMDMVQFLIEELNAEIVEHQMREQRISSAQRGSIELAQLLIQLSRILPDSSDCWLTFYDALLEQTRNTCRDANLETNYGSVRGYVPTISGLSDIAKQAGEFIKDAFNPQSRSASKVRVKRRHRDPCRNHQDNSDMSSSYSQTFEEAALHLNSKVRRLCSLLRNAINENNFPDLDNISAAGGRKRTLDHLQSDQSVSAFEAEIFPNPPKYRRVHIRPSVDNTMSWDSTPENVEGSESLNTSKAERDTDSTQQFSWAAPLSLDIESDDDSDLSSSEDDRSSVLWTDQYFSLQSPVGTNLVEDVKFSAAHDPNDWQSQALNISGSATQRFPANLPPTDKQDYEEHLSNRRIAGLGGTASRSSSNTLVLHHHDAVESFSKSRKQPSRQFPGPPQSYFDGLPHQTLDSTDGILVFQGLEFPEKASSEQDWELKPQRRGLSNTTNNPELDFDAQSLELLESGNDKKFAEDTVNPRYYQIMRRRESEFLEVAINTCLPSDAHRLENYYRGLSIEGDSSADDYASPAPQPKEHESTVPTAANKEDSSHLRGGALCRVACYPPVLYRETPVHSNLKAVPALPCQAADPCRRHTVGNSLWVFWFINSRGNEYFCDIDEEYLTDRFNLTSLNTEVQHYQYALDLITDVLDIDVDDDTREQIEKSARHLYGLVHARYIVTTRGLQKMCEKYKTGDFGKCPRVACDGQPLLPMGQHDTAHVSAVKLYCARCEDLYNPKSSRHASIDGAYFGSSFHNMFFQVYQNLMPSKSQRRYEPKIFGFRVHGPATLARWQATRREETKEMLKSEGLETGFEEEERGEEMEASEDEDDVGQDGIDDMFEGRRAF